MSDTDLTTVPASSIGRYRVVRLIAHGGMGSLYLARDPAIDRLVAIKLLKARFDDDVARESFSREARATGGLRHPNIVTVFDVDEQSNRPFIAMEYGPGETLAALMRRQAPLLLTDKLAVLEDLGAGLHFAHQAGILHRDIKPANIILDVSGSLKILDFGLARANDSNITESRDQLGTLNYMSPDQVVGDRLDQPSDVYAVGAVAYELVSYKKTFAGAPRAARDRRTRHRPGDPEDHRARDGQRPGSALSGSGGFAPGPECGSESTEVETVSLECVACLDGAPGHVADASGHDERVSRVLDEWLVSWSPREIEFAMR